MDDAAKTEARALIMKHVPSLSDEDEERIIGMIGTEDVADFALRTCACGQGIDGFYDYVDHLLELFGGESRLWLTDPPERNKP